MQGITRVACLAMIGALSACGGETPVVAKNTVSQGQEMVDLQRALDEGAIDQREYDKLKKVILKRAP